MRPRRGIGSTAAILLGALMAALIASPALAQPANMAADEGPTAVVPSAARRPDGRVRLQKYNSTVYSTAWKGNNIYNTTATGQKVTAPFFSTSPGSETWTFGISIQNDGSTSDRSKVQATGTARTGWTVRYFHGSTNITSAVVGGTFRTPLLAAGATYLIKAKVTRAADGFYSGDVARLITLTSVGDGTKKDAVMLVMKHQSCGC